MLAVLVVALGWLVFAGSHIGLASARVRATIEARLGRHGFVWVYSLVAWLTFTGLVVAYAQVQGAGPRGLALATIPAVRVVLQGVIAIGVVLMVAAFAPSGYWASPLAVLMDGVRPPWGLERITRHPFFCGLVLVALAHVLLVARLTTAIFFLGFAGLAVLGTLHQRGKLRARHGEPFDRWLATTSPVPFLAILRGDQRLVLHELPWVWVLAGVAAVYGLWRVHDGIMAWHGLPLVVAIVGGSALIGWISIRREAARAR